MDFLRWGGGGGGGGGGARSCLGGETLTSFKLKPQAINVKKGARVI